MEFDKESPHAQSDEGTDILHRSNKRVRSGEDTGDPVRRNWIRRGRTSSISCLEIN